MGKFFLVRAGNRHRVNTKSFRSIRHSVVSIARNSAELTADMVRDTVGHKSEEVERGYYTAGDASKAKVMAVLADAVQGAVVDDADAGVA